MKKIFGILIYTLRGKNIIKKEITNTKYGHLTFRYFFTNFLKVFEDVYLLIRPEAFFESNQFQYKNIVKNFSS